MWKCVLCHIHLTHLQPPTPLCVCPSETLPHLVSFPWVGGREEKPDLGEREREGEIGREITTQLLLGRLFLLRTFLERNPFMCVVLALLFVRCSDGNEEKRPLLSLPLLLHCVIQRSLHMRREILERAWEGDFCVWRTFRKRNEDCM